jgi:hypothetical protein
LFSLGLMPEMLYSSRKPMVQAIRQKMFRVAIHSLVIVTPIIWVAGFCGAFYGTNAVILDHRIHDVRSFVYCLLVGPILALFIGFAFWLLILVPFQLLDWFIGEVSDLLCRLRRAGLRRGAHTEDLTRR